MVLVVPPVAPAGLQTTGNFLVNLLVGMGESKEVGRCDLSYFSSGVTWTVQMVIPAEIDVYDTDSWKGHRAL